MKTVYDRLRTEARERLLEQESRYPSLVKDIIDELQYHYYYTNIRYGIAIEFEHFTNIPLNEAVESLH